MKKILILLIPIFVFTSLASCRKIRTQYSIFSDIRELDAIESLCFTNQSLNKYDTPSEDKYIKNLEYTEFYAAEFKSKELSFEIFAYTFADVEVAKKYFNNATGKDMDKGVNFLLSGGIINSRLVLMDYERVYRVTTATDEVDILMDVFEKLFSKTLVF